MSSLRQPHFLLVSNQSEFLTLGAFLTRLPSLWRWCSLCDPACHLPGVPCCSQSSTLTVPIMFSVTYPIFQDGMHTMSTPTQPQFPIRKMKQVHPPAHCRGVEGREDGRMQGKVEKTDEFPRLFSGFDLLIHRRG